MCQSYGFSAAAVHPNQYVVGAGLGQVGVHQLEDVRRPEPLLNNRLHQVTSYRRALSC
jgi:hypothetical protein